MATIQKTSELVIPSATAYDLLQELITLTWEISWSYYCRA